VLAPAEAGDCEIESVSSASMPAEVRPAERDDRQASRSEVYGRPDERVQCPTWQYSSVR